MRESRICAVQQKTHIGLFPSHSDTPRGSGTRGGRDGRGHRTDPSFSQRAVLGLPGWVALIEDGITGWGTVRGITRALQTELGIPVDGVFGDGMMENVPVVSPGTSVNASILALISCGLRCKGYDGTPVGGFGFGQYDSRDQNAVAALRSDASYPHGGSNSVSPQIWKGLCRMDAYVLVPSGDAEVRHIQQRINEQYGNEANTGLSPTDGIASAAVTRGAIGGLQAELGLTVDGIWGPSTASGVYPVGPGDNAPGAFNEIAQWGLYLNGFPHVCFPSLSDSEPHRPVRRPRADPLGEEHDSRCCAGTSSCARRSWRGG